MATKANQKTTIALKLGVEARDKVTGFKGIVTGKAEYLTGCTQYGIVPKTGKTGSMKSTEWFDENRLEVVGKGMGVSKIKGPDNGGPQRDTPRG